MHLFSKKRDAIHTAAIPTSKMKDGLTNKKKNGFETKSMFETGNKTFYRNVQRTTSLPASKDNNISPQQKKNSIPSTFILEAKQDRKTDSIDTLSDTSSTSFGSTTQQSMHQTAIMNQISSSQQRSNALAVKSSRSRNSGLYVDLVADKGKEAFLEATTPRRPQLVSTPSMMMVNEIKKAMENNESTLKKMTNESTGGVYELHWNKSDSPKKQSTNPIGRSSFVKPARRMAVFKPDDESGWDKTPNLRVGIITDGSRMERAAYLLDRNCNNFSGIPPTQLAKLRALDSEMRRSSKEATGLQQKGPRVRRKRGSIQQFCDNDGSTEDRYDLRSMASPFEVQKIGILDIRILNTDRHGGNILCKQHPDGTVELIPIDHALSLPDWYHLSQAYFDWCFWPQASAALDEIVVQHINDIDIEKDAQTLKQLEIPMENITTNTICTLLLKVGVNNGIETVKEFAEFVQRPYPAGHPKHDQHLSPLEYYVREAAESCGINYLAGMDNGNPKAPPAYFFDCLKDILEKSISTKEWKNYVI